MKFNSTIKYINREIILFINLHKSIYYATNCIKFLKTRKISIICKMQFDATFRNNDSKWATFKCCQRADCWVIVKILFQFEIRVDNFRNVPFKNPSLKVSERNANGKYSVKWTNNFITVYWHFFPPTDVWAFVNNLFYHFISFLPNRHRKIAGMCEINRNVSWGGMKFSRYSLWLRLEV